MALAVMALAVAYGGESNRTIEGSIVLDDVVGQPCSGSGGYDDIRAGAQVVVRDAFGTVVGTGSLGSGIRMRAGECKFPFNVEDLPKSDFYSIEVSHRGEINYSAEELEERGWQVSLTLGD